MYVSTPPSGDLHADKPATARTRGRAGRRPISRARLKELHPDFQLEFGSLSELAPDRSEDGVTRWSLVAYATISETDVDLLGGDAKAAGDGFWTVPIFSMYGVALRLGDPHTNLAVWLDDESGDLSEFITLLDRNDLNPGLVAPFAFGDDLVIADHARLDPRWRGHGIGRLIIGLGLERHFPGARLFAAMPCPVELLEEHRQDREHPLFVAGLASVRRTWESLGFTQAVGDIWVKDPGRVDGSKHLAALRTRIHGR